MTSNAQSGGGGEKGFGAFGSILTMEIGPDARDTHEYFRKLRKKLRASLLAAYLIPLAILSVYFHFKFDMALK